MSDYLLKLLPHHRGPSPEPRPKPVEPPAPVYSFTSDALTIAYLTSRRDPKFEWFCASLDRISAGVYSGLRVVVVDFYAEAHRAGDGWTEEDAAARRAKFRALCPCPDFVHTTPIWNPWQGPHRRTKSNWFAKADYLNAAVCHTPGRWLASCDDLSVLQDDWLYAARQATLAPNVITCGAYRKVRRIQVEAGTIVGCQEYEKGKDTRWPSGSDAGPVPCCPNWMYGYFVAPVEAILKANGWPQVCHGMGYEDCAMGTVIGRNGYEFQYDRRLLAIESDEHHFDGRQMRREDPCLGDPNAKPRNDKSHALNRLAENSKRFENFYGWDGLAAVRERVLKGAPLPVITEPAHEWFTGRKLEELEGDSDPVLVDNTPRAPAPAMSPELQAQVLGAHARVHGFKQDDDRVLALCSELELLHPVSLVVAIGIFAGKTELPLALRLKALGQGRLVAIDPWSAEASVAGENEVNAAWWRECDHERVYQDFLAYRQAFGLEGIIEVRRAKSDDVTPPSVIDLLLIDGNHTEQALRDADRFASRVRVGGVCVLDDLDWEGGWVRRAEDRLFQLGYTKQYDLGTGAVYRRIHV